MDLTLDDFCEVVKRLNKTNAEKAVAILWFFDRRQSGVVMTAGKLARALTDYHIGNPNPTALASGIKSTRLVNETSRGFALKPGSSRIIQEWFPALDGIQPAMDQTAGYLPEAVWKNTRGYIEAVARELNGCFKSAYYNAACVLLRRLLETLIIEAYEHLNRESEIKDANGNYFMLADLVERACGEKGYAGLNLGRDSKTALKGAREIGNWAAHARRYIAHASDLKNVQSGMRLVVQELVHIANPKRG